VNTQRSMSDLVNDAVRMALREDREDREDLSAFDERAEEPTMSYEELLIRTGIESVKAHTE